MVEDRASTGVGRRGGIGGIGGASSKLLLIRSGAQSVLLSIFTYSTVRSATIQSLGVGIVYRSVQIIMLCYIIGFDIIKNRGYQQLDTVSSVITTKVKGQGFVPINAKLTKPNRTHINEYYKELFTLKTGHNYKILDTADYVIPPSEYNSIFIMTNFIETEQTQGICDEEPSKYKAQCTSDNDCHNLGTLMNTWNGIPTGRCIASSVRANVSVCEVSAWCPAEHDNDRNDDNIIRNVLNYTIFVKNDVDFKKLNRKERNILPNITNKYISMCNYRDNVDQFCPVFQLNYMLSKAETNETERYLMLLKGGVILIEISWDCDYDIISLCLPKYTFRRFDLPFRDTSTASGFNFRFAHKFKNGDKEYRVLYKAFGLRIIISVSGTGRRFDIIPLSISIGAGVGILSISSYIADCVMLNCTKNTRLFQQIKQLDMKDVVQTEPADSLIVTRV